MQRNFAQSAKVSHLRDSKAIRQGWRNAVIRQAQTIWGARTQPKLSAANFYFRRFDSAEVHCYPEETVQERVRNRFKMCKSTLPL